MPKSEIVAFVIFISLIIGIFIWFGINKKRSEKHIIKRFMILESTTGQGAFFGGVIGCTTQIPELLLNLGDNNEIWIYVFSAYMVLFLLFLYALIIHNRKKALEYLHEHFPHLMV